MTTPVPQFPGKPAQTGQKTEPWQHAICPFLTAGEIARQGPPSALVQLGPDKRQALVGQACIGPKCMLFVTLRTPTGEQLQGCAPVHAMQSALTLNAMVGQFIEAAKAGAAAEAEAVRLEAEAEAAKIAALTPTSVVTTPTEIPKDPTEPPKEG